MTKSQLIKDVATNKIDLEESLQRLLIITSELDNEMISEWIISELNGYGQDDIIPNYRKRISYRIVYSGINGKLKMTNQTLPLHYFSKEVRDDIDEITVKESIKVIENIAKNGEKIGFDLTALASDVFENTGIQCYKIFQEYSNISFEQLLSNVKTRLILFLLDLEKQFGNLDNLDIETEKITSDKKEEVTKRFAQLFYDGKVRPDE